MKVASEMLIFHLSPKKSQPEQNQVLAFAPGGLAPGWRGREYLDFLALSGWVASRVTKRDGGAFGAKDVSRKRALFHCLLQRWSPQVGLQPSKRWCEHSPCKASAGRPDESDC